MLSENINILKAFTGSVLLHGTVIVGVCGAFLRGPEISLDGTSGASLGKSFEISLISESELSSANLLVENSSIQDLQQRKSEKENITQSGQVDYKKSLEQAVTPIVHEAAAVEANTKPLPQIVSIKQRDISAKYAAKTSSNTPKSAAFSSAPKKDLQNCEGNCTNSAAPSQSDAGQNGQGENSGVSNGTEALHSPKPPYPWAARRAGFQGQVALAINIDQEGKVARAEVVESSGRSDCDQSALKTISSEWRFKPATLLGKPMTWQEKVVVVYQLDN